MKNSFYLVKIPEINTSTIKFFLEILKTKKGCIESTSLKYKKKRIIRSQNTKLLRTAFISAGILD